MDKYVTNTNNTIQAALLDPSQSRFLELYGVSAAVIEECWTEILADALDPSLLPPVFATMEKAALAPIMQGQVAALRATLENATVEPTAEDPLEFYRSELSTARLAAPLFMPVVKLLLAVPGSESHCERSFSWAGGFITKLRTATGDDLLELQMVLYDYFSSRAFNWETFRDTFLSKLTAMKDAVF